MRRDMKTIYAPDRRGTNSYKWDAMKGEFGTDGLLPLWVADMDFKAPDCVHEALRTVIDLGIYGYHVPPASYYESIISWERRRHGYEIKKEWLRYTLGVVPGLYWFTNILTRINDACIILTPCYYPFMEAIRNTGRRLVCCDLKCSGGRYTIDFEKFEAEICANDVKLFILCSPHNPVGRVWTQQELKGLLDVCGKHGVYVISDEIHQDIVMTGHKNIPAATVGAYDDFLVTLSATSKTFNMAGLKNSFAIIPDQGIRKKFDQYVNSIQVMKGSMFGYAATEAAYNHGEPWLEEVLAVIEGNYRYLRDTLLAELPEIVVTPLEGTYLMWVDLGAYVSHQGLRALVQNECKLAVDYGDWFFEKGADTHIRINLATPRENIQTAAQNLIRGIILGERKN